MRNNGLNVWRVSALIVVFVVAALNVVHLARTVPPPVSEGPITTLSDPVTRHEQRLEALQKNIRRRGLTGKIGYVGDLPGPRLGEDPRGVEDFYLTQFALVPLLLDADSETCEWAVANLRTANPLVRVPAEWHIAEDFGTGVLLLRRSTP